MIITDSEPETVQCIDRPEICGGVSVDGVAGACPPPTALVWRDPPADRRVLLSPAVIDLLRAHPGRWAVIREYRSRTAVKRVRGVKHPVDIEVRGVEEPPGSVLYARAKPGASR